MGFNPNWQNDYGRNDRRSGGQNRNRGNDQYGGRQNRNGGYGQNRDRGNDRGGYGQNQSLPPKLEAEPLPEDYVEKAEDVIRVIAGKGKRDQLSTSKLRNLYSLVTDLMDREQLRTEPTLLGTSVAALQRMRIRLAYESGRERSVELFVKEARLIQYLKDIGDSREKLLNFAHYMEALVAYHRFYHVGPRE